MNKYSVLIILIIFAGWLLYVGYKDRDNTKDNQ